jgi:hypothetical protein
MPPELEWETETSMLLFRLGRPGRFGNPKYEGFVQNSGVGPNLRPNEVR